MDTGTLLLLVGAGLAGGAVNAIAGGGTLISFPALVAAGCPSLVANFTKTVALWPGYLGGVIGFRSDLTGQARRTVTYSVTSVAGAIVGCLLLLVTPGQVFDAVVPVLILLACALLATQSWVTRAVRRLTDPAARRARPLAAGDPRDIPAAGDPLDIPAAGDPLDVRVAVGAGSRAVFPDGGPGSTWGATATATMTRAEPAPRTGLAALLLHSGVFLGGAYGAYFGAGLGVLLLGVLGPFLPDRFNRINALRNVLALVINSVAVLAFVSFSPVRWSLVLLMAPASLVGGFFGARIARRLPADVLRFVVVVFGVIVAAILAVR